MHLTKHGTWCCMQAKQLPTKRMVELKDNSIIGGLLTTSSEYMAEIICYLDDTWELMSKSGGKATIAIAAHISGGVPKYVPQALASISAIATTFW
jgi:hypothetical protein